MMDFFSAYGKPLTIVPFILLLFLPAFWPFRYSALYIQDLPNHLANVYILLNYNKFPLFQQYFSLHFNLYPYLLQDLLLSIFIPLGGVNFAGNLLVSLALISVPLAFLFLVYTVRPDKPYLCYFSLPLIWNELVSRGNLNFMLGMSFSLVCTAYLWRLLVHKTVFSRKNWAALMTAGFLLYLSHIVTFGLTLFILLVLVLFDRIKQKQYAFAGTVLGIVFLGTVIFLFLTVDSGAYHPFGMKSLSEKTFDLYPTLRTFLPGDSDSKIPPLVILALSALLLLGIPRIKEEPLPFIICGSLLLAYFLAPQSLGPQVRPHQRIFCLFLYLLPLCFVGRRFIAIERIAVILLCVPLFFHAYAYAGKVQDLLSMNLLEGRRAIEAIPEGKKLYYFSSFGLHTKHLGSYYIIDRQGYVPTQFSASYMTVRYRKPPPIGTESTFFDYRTLKMFDYFLICGGDKPLIDFITRNQYTLVMESGNYRLFKNSLPSTDLN